MFEITILVCAFVNSYSVELGCDIQKMEAPSCGAVHITEPRLYHPTDNPAGDLFIKSVSCEKMVPVAPEQTDEVKSA